MCDQQSLRPACAYAQSDQSLCLSLEYSMSVKLLTEHRLEFLSLKGGCTGSYESILVKMPHCWKSHVTAYFTFQNLPFVDDTRTKVAKLRHLTGDLTWFVPVTSLWFGKRLFYLVALYDWRESCLRIGPICLLKSLGLPEKWSKLTKKVI